MMKISIGQGILILIDLLNKKDTKACNQLKKIYLSGIETSEDRTFVIGLFLRHHLSKKYEISGQPEIVNDDVSRRYFETHLAFYTLYHSLDALDHGELTKHYSYLLDALPVTIRKQFPDQIEHDCLSEEYLHGITMISNHDNYKVFTSEQKEKLKLLLQISWLSILNLKYDMYERIPMDYIYGTGFFSTQARGRIEKPEIDSSVTEPFKKKLPFYSKNFGLMKCYMPLPKNDLAYAEEGFTSIKPSDYYSCIFSAAWPKKNFSSMIHPFSCSISGTTLSQLRVLKYLNNKNPFFMDSTESFMQFFKCFTSILLFNSGGHSYNEFFSVLQIQEIMANFKFIKQFDQIDMEKVLFDHNEPAFNQALEDTIAYNKVILAKQACHEKLLSRKIS